MANEIVNAYLKELKISPARDRADMNARLERVAGKRLATALRAGIEEDRIHETDFQESAYGSLRIALEVVGIADADYLRNACEYILQYSAGFGPRVLDAGCGCGLLTCFIARNYPQSKVVGIDRSANAIRCAKTLAQQLEISNVSFICGEVSELPEEQYNTVFCSRVLAENLVDTDIDESVYWYDMLTAEAVGQKRVHGFAVALVSHIAPDGCLISMEDRDRDPQLYAYLTTLNELGTGVIPQTCTQWECGETGEKLVQAMIAHRGSRLDHENLYWIWATLLSRGVDMSSPSFNGYIGDVFVRRIRNNLLMGMNMLDDNGRVVRKMMFWDSKREQDADTCYLQQLNLDENTRLVECYTAGAKKIVEDYFVRCEKGWKARGRKTSRFTLDENYEEIPLKEE